MPIKTDIQTGCCGFAASHQEYFRQFNLVEIQQTFYHPPKLRTADKWRENAPPGFEFTLKAWQLITHQSSSPTYRRLKKKIDPVQFDHYGRFQLSTEVLEAWNQTARFAETLQATIIVFQCPASFQPKEENINNMYEFFKGIDRQKFRFVWEPRGSWSRELILQICKDLQIIHGVDPFKDIPQWGEFQYFRLHGIRNYTYQYTDADLERLKQWVKKKPSYVLFNNRWMIVDALRFKELIQRLH